MHKNMHDTLYLLIQYNKKNYTTLTNTVYYNYCFVTFFEGSDVNFYETM